MRVFLMGCSKELRASVATELQKAYMTSMPRTSVFTLDAIVLSEDQYAAIKDLLDQFKEENT